MAMNGVSTVDLSDRTVGFIGGGNMARAIGVPLIEKGILNAKQVWVSARTEQTLEFWRKRGVNATLRNHEVLENCRIVVLAVKPQFLDAAMATMLTKSVKPELVINTLFISVMVGIPIQTIERMIRRLSDVIAKRIIRTMPNTPLSVAEGITVYCNLPEVEGTEDQKLVESLFSPIGVVEKVDESLMNVVGGLAGSGPAYAYLMIEALADGAVKNGLPRTIATRLAAQVLVGAGKMVLGTSKHPGQLKDEVCSPGGTTIAGMHALETGGVRVSLMNAVEAAVQRAKELAS